VHLQHALVVVLAMGVMDVPVVQVVHMVPVLHESVPTAVAVGVLMGGVRRVLRRRCHPFVPSMRILG
jgi:hypothetical protein